MKVMNVKCLLKMDLLLSRSHIYRSFFTLKREILKNFFNTIKNIMLEIYVFLFIYFMLLIKSLSILTTETLFKRLRTRNFTRNPVGFL